MTLENSLACLHTPEVLGDVEGINPTFKVVESLDTTNKPYRVFNNNNNNNIEPDTMNTINFEDMFTDFSNNIMIEPTDNSFNFTLPDSTASTADHILTKCTKSETSEDVWGVETFEEFNVCVSPAAAEGMVMLPLVKNEEEEEKTTDTNDDFLKWIIETEIGELSPVCQEPSATTSQWVMEEMEEERPMKRARMADPNLTEEEKYRRMREQNNKASRECRAKRKTKVALEMGELEKEQARNIRLKIALQKMEEEVSIFKKKVLTGVANNAKTR